MKLWQARKNNKLAGEGREPPRHILGAKRKRDLEDDPSSRVLPAGLARPQSRIPDLDL